MVPFPVFSFHLRVISVILNQPTYSSSHGPRRTTQACQAGGGATP